MKLWVLAGAAALLSLERICYIWAWRFPESFRRFCANRFAVKGAGPVEALQRLFYIFKAIQLIVFLGWCWSFGGGTLLPEQGHAVALTLGGILILTGQFLNVSVFYRLGETGVFYGSRYGYRIPWCEGFPFSLMRHPQYVGAVLSIWGFFLAMRFPNKDWAVLPSLETAYYMIGAYAEQ